MKGTSKVILGATLVMVMILALVLGLVLLLLAELYCSMLLRSRRQLRLPSSTTATAGTTPANDASSRSQKPPQDQFLSPQPLRSFYAPGVLNAPRSFLFPAVLDNGKEDNLLDTEKQQKPSTTSPPVSPPFVVSRIPPTPIDKITHQSDSTRGEHMIYILNPMYDDVGGRGSRVATPFATPDTSPSRLGDDGFPGDGIEESSPSSSPNSSVRVTTTPPLTPMKKLSADGCSVSLRDARSLATSGSSDSNSNNDGHSSSSSGSPYTSPSW